MRKINKASALLAILAVLCTVGQATIDTYAMPAEDMPAREAAEEADVSAIYAVPLDADIQLSVADICEDYHIDPVIILAMMDTESDYDIYAVGDSGNAIGLMQVQPRWHLQRIAELGVTDLFDPAQNVLVAVDYLAECLDNNGGDMGRALVVYNAGQTGANNGWFRHGIYESEYSREVLATAQIISEGAMSYVCP